ncbi:uncharacterized protein AKAW2_80156S [Aspergillus luchuensis]|uniref:Fibroin-3 related protein n=2 Tax=Aspergillus subgen. Circumdati TaxID=2720871 RepID=A0A146F824_ASPKA|nr:hypothetical protein BO85DRAFT_372068 [Aspergillus piperis CBS 112811]XP_041548117.1 uncharacterized protein AKAW2_80156S [Aspergillus luchuensis]GAA84042.1 hypothetical protein AKAW_02157 [Aspergillus luchuensis IFO 4308]RAH57569.1 hypothetical protein BO85DRAFT_372068 [Aspergillus piperis CBS 112811]BCS04355.1 hypothetical protein AKAW2_80156S [Aspergillus luchuensis]BCS15944.1 hypothetical protein ALUC_80151S [Aspergillus luchuensis]GAT22146.1 hypothetical protein RIB2604_01501780 [Aspe
MSPVDKAPVPLWARDVVSDLKSDASTFTSWDKCMSKAYCKWPVIVAIIIAALIVLSVIACVINCLCCGVQCCKCCCGCCFKCCPGFKRKRNKQKYLDDQYDQPPPMPAMPTMPAPMNNAYQTPYQPQAPPVYRGAEVARFDTPSSPANGKFDEDALPAMPTWEGAVTKKVEDENPHAESLEMKPLSNANQEPRRMPSGARSVTGGYGGPPPLRTGTPAAPGAYHAEPRGYDGYDGPDAYGYHAPGPRSPPPVSPYEHQPYSEYPHEDRFHNMSPAPTYTTQPQYMPMDATQPHHAPMDGMQPYQMPMDGMHPNYMPPEPAHPHYMPQHQMPPDTGTYGQPMPINRTFSPAPTLHSAMNAPRPVPYRQPSPGFQAPPYRNMSPATPTSPPPPFSTTPAPRDANEPGRPPSLLQSGRRPTNF